MTKVIIQMYYIVIGYTRPEEEKTPPITSRDISSAFEQSALTGYLRVIPAWESELQYKSRTIHEREKKKEK